MFGLRKPNSEAEDRAQVDLACKRGCVQPSVSVKRKKEKLNTKERVGVMGGKNERTLERTLDKPRNTQQGEKNKGTALRKKEPN